MTDRKFEEECHIGRSGTMAWWARYRYDDRSVRITGNGFSSDPDYAAQKVCIRSSGMTTREAEAFALGLKVLHFLETGRLPEGNVLSPYAYLPEAA
jgi:hypothetical protein